MGVAPAVREVRVKVCRLAPSSENAARSCCGGGAAPRARENASAPTRARGSSLSGGGAAAAAPGRPRDLVHAAHPKSAAAEDAAKPRREAFRLRNPTRAQPCDDPWRHSWYDSIIDSK